MARTIKDAFTGGKAFIPFITAGDPNLEKTVDVYEAAADYIAAKIAAGATYAQPVFVANDANSPVPTKEVQ